MRANLVAATLILATLCASAQEKDPMFTVADFAHLRFLEGRWQGTGPDGKPFFEQYSFPTEAQMQTSRFADDRFAEASDGSVVTLVDEQVTATWNGFSWQASELVDGRACFQPINAPSAFCWERKSDSLVEVTQRWTGEDGEPQQFVLPLRRL